MDKIHKIINLEQAKNRTPNPIKHYVIDYDEHKCKPQYDDTFGGYCCDILIPITSNDCVPLITWAYDLDEIYHFERVEVTAFDIINHDVDEPGCGECDPEDIVEAYWFRYKNLMVMYHWLLNAFIPSIDFYQKCTNGYKSIKVSDRKEIFKTDIEIFPELPLDDELEPGTIIGVTSLYDEFKSKFKNAEICKLFLIFVERLLSDGIFAPVSATTPYIDVELSITSNSTDLGIMSPVCEEWIPNKKYYLGEVVLHDGITYYLQHCDTDKFEIHEITGALLESVLAKLGNYNVTTNLNNIPSETFSTSIPSTYEVETDYLVYKQCLFKEVSNGLTRWYFIYPYDTGTYDAETKTTSFSRNWEKYVPSPNQYLSEYDEYTGITESKLISLKRKISSVDDFGEILPFIIKWECLGLDCHYISRTPFSVCPECGSTRYNPDNTHGEILYMTGVTNERLYEDGTFRGDALTYVGISHVNSSDENDWTDISSESITSDVFNTNGYIKFRYIIRCELDSSKNILPRTGVYYEEVWEYTKKEMTVRIQNSNHTFDYISITPIDSNEPISNLDISDKKPILSKITYYGKELNYIDYLLAPYIKKEELLGVQDINTTEYDMHSGRYVNTINGYIQRGTAGALERHQILGEVKTFADLENYRNNFFQI